MIDRVTADLLGGHVVNGSQRPFGGPLLGVGHTPGQAEVAQPRVQGLLGALAAGDEHVGGLDVAMDEPGAVGDVQRARHLLEDHDRGVRGEAALATDHPLQVAARDIAHRHVQDPLHLAGVVDGDDVGVVEAGGQDRLVEEVLAEGGVGALLGGQELERHVTLQTQLDRPVDGAHAAAADDGLDAITGGFEGRLHVQTPNHG